MNSKLIDAEYRLCDQWELRRMLNNLESTVPGPDWTEWQRATLATDTEYCAAAQIAATRGQEVYVAVDDDGYWFAVGFNPTGWIARLNNYLETLPGTLVADDLPLFYTQEPDDFADHQINIQVDVAEAIYTLLALDGTGVDPEVEICQVAAHGADLWEIRVSLTQAGEPLFSATEPFALNDYATPEQRERRRVSREH